MGVTSCDESSSFPLVDQDQHLLVGKERAAPKVMAAILLYWLTVSEMTVGGMTSIVSAIKNILTAIGGLEIKSLHYLMRMITWNTEMQTMQGHFMPSVHLSSTLIMDFETPGVLSWRTYSVEIMNSQPAPNLCRIYSSRMHISLWDLMGFIPEF